MNPTCKSENSKKFKCDTARYTTFSRMLNYNYIRNAQFIIFSHKVELISYDFKVKINKNQILPCIDKDVCGAIGVKGTLEANPPSIFVEFGIPVEATEEVVFIEEPSRLSKIFALLVEELLTVEEVELGCPLPIRKELSNDETKRKV